MFRFIHKPKPTLIKIERRDGSSVHVNMDQIGPEPAGGYKSPSVSFTNDTPECELKQFQVKVIKKFRRSVKCHFDMIEELYQMAVLRVLNTENKLATVWYVSNLMIGMYINMQRDRKYDHKADYIFYVEQKRSNNHIDIEDWLLSLKPKIQNVMRFKLAGYNNEEIANKLDITERTVLRQLQALRQSGYPEIYSVLPIYEKINGVWKEQEIIRD